MLHTTFKSLRNANACKESYVKFAKAVGGIKAYGDDTPIPLVQVLEVNGLEDAIWCLRCVLPEETEARDKLARLFAADCAERVLPLFEARYPDDKRPGQAIDTARLFAHGQATQEELDAAWDAAWDAWDAAGDAAGAAAGDAARAAWAAAGAAARDAAGAAAGAAARAAWAAAERDWQTQRLREYLTDGGE